MLAVLATLLMFAIGHEQSATASPSNPSGPAGEVGFGATVLPSGPERAQTESVVIRNYRGQAVTALQMTIICDWPYRLDAVRRGPAVADSSSWRLFIELRPGHRNGSAIGADTARIVLLSTSLSGLGPAEQSGILFLIVRPPATVQAGSTASATLRVAEVIGALPSGDNAGLTPGPSKILGASTR
jgi:hypothetical protein